MTNSTEEKPNGMMHVVIVRGGFAGFHCARKLAANPHVRVTLLDKNNYQQFQPLLYLAATAVLSPSNIASIFADCWNGFLARWLPHMSAAVISGCGWMSELDDGEGRYERNCSS